jgi:hypothetical protein
MLDQETILDAVRRIQERIQNYDPPKQEPTGVLELDGDEASAPVVEAPAVSQSTVSTTNIWHHPDAHPVVLDLMLFRQYGPQFLSWEAESLKRLIPEDFHTSGVSELNLSKIQAVKALHLVDTYWEDWEVFLWCTMSLNGVFPNFEIMQAPTVAQCLVSVDIANHLRDDVPWSDEVKAFLDVCFRHDGLFVRLDPINFITLQVDPTLADFKSVETRWQKVKESKKGPTGITPEDEQLRRMLTSYKYLEESRAHLRQQLNLVGRT